MNFFLLILLAHFTEAKIGFYPKNISESQLDTAIPLLYCLSDRHSKDWELVSNPNHNPLLVVSAKEGEIVIEWTIDGQTKTFSQKDGSVEEICHKLSPMPLIPEEPKQTLPTSPPETEKKIKAWHIGLSAVVLGVGAFLLFRPQTKKHSGVLLE